VSATTARTRIAERDFQKIVLQRQLSDLCIERLHVDGRSVGPGACRRPDYPGSPFLELQFSSRDLVGVNVEMLSQLGYPVLAP
jgi:hypothetical protein